MHNNLIISEKFTSIQGEGQTMGKKAIFLRLAGCNILCKSEHWVCDTIEVWRKGVSTAFENVFSRDDILNLSNGYHLIITGGEPLLHQNGIIEFLWWFKKSSGFLPKIEVETNGTITPYPRLLELVDYWNVSPKLENSGVGLVRINYEALDKFNMMEGTIFKFVVNNEDDVMEIAEYRKMNLDKVYLMPAGSLREELEITRPKTIEWCLKYGFNYSERLHIVIWNQKTGV